MIYEVNLWVKPEIEKEFSLWLEDHVQELLRMEGFLAAQIYRVPKEYANPDDPLKPIFVVHYEMESEAALRNYLENHAPLMRQKGVDRFGSNLRASRRVLMRH